MDAVGKKSVNTAITFAKAETSARMWHLNIARKCWYTEGKLEEKCAYL